MTLPIVTPGQLRVLADLADGARLTPPAQPPSGSLGVTFLLRRGRHLRGVRARTVLRLYSLLLVRRGRITDAGRLVLAMETVA